MCESWVSWALAQSTQNAPAKLVLITLAYQVDATGRCRQSIAGLAESTGIAECTMRGKLKALEARGLIRCQIKRGMHAESRFQLARGSTGTRDSGKAVADA